MSTPEAPAKTLAIVPTANSKAVEDEAAGVSSALENLSIDRKEKPCDAPKEEDAPLPPDRLAVTSNEVGVSSPLTSLLGLTRS